MKYVLQFLKLGSSPSLLAIGIGFLMSRPTEKLQAPESLTMGIALMTGAAFVGTLWVLTAECIWRNIWGAFQKVRGVVFENRRSVEIGGSRKQRSVLLRKAKTIRRKVRGGQHPRICKENNGSTIREYGKTCPRCGEDISDGGHPPLI
jgi:hypothetical protein